MDCVDDNTAWQVQRYPGNKYKSFLSLVEAQEWIKPPTSSTPNPHRFQVKYSPGLLAPILPSSPDYISISSSPEPPVPSNPPPTQAEELPVTTEPGVTLSPEQTYVLSKVKSGGNVFFTGSAGGFRDNTEGFLISHVAGTGKSVLLRQIIGWARGRRKGDTDVAVTASTGMAAVNIGGVTLHSWAGIGLGQGDLKRYVEAVKFGPGHWKKIRERWMVVKTLIIDESNVGPCGSDPPADKVNSIYDRLRPV